MYDKNDFERYFWGDFQLFPEPQIVIFNERPPNSLSCPKIKTLELLYNLQALSVKKSKKCKGGFSQEFFTFNEDKNHGEKIDEQI